MYDLFDLLLLLKITFKYIINGLQEYSDRS